MRATIGLCVAWNPEMIPQAMVTKRHGNKGFAFWKSVKSAQSEKMSGYQNPSQTRAPKIATDPIMRSAPKNGYTLPMILSTGNRVAAI